MFPKGKQNAYSKVIDWLNDTIKGSLLDLKNATDTVVKAIIGATNPGTPVNMNVTAHGFAVGDIIVQGGIVGSLACNGTFKIKTVPDADHYTLQTTTPEALDVTNSGAYVSGGWVINLTKAQNFQDLDACQIGTQSSAFAGKTDTDGVLRANDPTFTAVPNGSISQAMVVSQATGTPATDKLVSFHDGKHQVIVAKAVALNDTAIACEPLESAIPNPSTFVFSNGISVTTNGAAAQFARSIPIAAAAGAIAAGHTADAPSLVSTAPSFPISGNGGNLVLNIDPAANGLVNT